jgi:hypothetical protein
VANEPAELNDLLVRRTRAGGSAPVQPDQVPAPPAAPAPPEAAGPTDWLPEPSDRVVMQNVQVRLPEPVADRLRMLAPMLRRKQQGILEEIITKGVDDLWRQIEERRRGSGHQ